MNYVVILNLCYFVTVGFKGMSDVWRNQLLITQRNVRRRFRAGRVCIAAEGFEAVRVGCVGTM